MIVTVLDIDFIFLFLVVVSSEKIYQTFKAVFNRLSKPVVFVSLSAWQSINQ